MALWGVRVTSRNICAEVYIEGLTRDSLNRPYMLETESSVPFVQGIHKFWVDEKTVPDPESVHGRYMICYDILRCRQTGRLSGHVNLMYPLPAGRKVYEIWSS